MNAWPSLTDPHLVPPPDLSDSELASWLSHVRQMARAKADLEMRHGRKELAWHRDVVLEGFFNTYDPSLRDADGQWHVQEFLEDGRVSFGGYDLVLLWQPYPRSGIDPRDQFDHWRDLPGGHEGLRSLVQSFQQRGVRVMLNYVPWDRPDLDHLPPLEELLIATGADGVYGDTMRGFPDAWVQAVEQINPAMAFSSEASPLLPQAAGMVGCWGQNLFPVPPNIPLVKFADGRHNVRLVDRDSLCRRSRIHLGLFWGMGHVVWENVFGMWNPYSADDRAEIRRATAIHRGLLPFLRDRDWIHQRGSDDGIYINQWRHDGQVILTTINTNRLAGSPTPILLPSDAAKGAWRNQMDGRIVEPSSDAQGRRWLSWDQQPFLPAVWTPVDFPWYGQPSAESPTPMPRHWAVELMNRPINQPTRTNRPIHPSANLEMVHVPGGSFLFSPKHYDGLPEGGCYDCRFKCTGGMNMFHHSRELVMPAMMVSRYEITNGQYQRFLIDSGWRPSVPDKFLAHWDRIGDEPRHWRIPPGLENHPVVHVDLNDARAYARWAGACLPTEEEWAWIAQGSAGRIWPWGDRFDPDRVVGSLDPRYFSDSPEHLARVVQYGVASGSFGRPARSTEPVDACLPGSTPDGVADLCGNVWEWTESERDDGHFRYAILKGGGWYSGQLGDSQWYLYRGPTPNAVHQKVPLLWPGLDRASTIGFRCISSSPPP